MATDLTQSQISAVSTQALKKMLRAENMGTFTTSLGDKWVDPLDPTITNLIDTLSKDLEQIKYIVGTPMTTISNQLYGYTSAWWIILYINGYMHSDEISDGAILKVPTAIAMNNVLRETAANNRGKEVTT